MSVRAAKSAEVSGDTLKEFIALLREPERLQGELEKFAARKTAAEEAEEAAKQARGEAEKAKAEVDEAAAKLAEDMVLERQKLADERKAFEKWVADRQAEAQLRLDNLVARSEQIAEWDRAFADRCAAADRAEESNASTKAYLDATATELDQRKAALNERQELLERQAADLARREGVLKNRVRTLAEDL